MCVSSLCGVECVCGVGGGEGVRWRGWSVR